MSNVKVSICIPAYKQVKYLRKTLESIKQQTFQDYEIILTDDSPDDVVKNFVETFDFRGRLKYFKNEKNLGSPENWNEAIRHATGEYIKILHHDDWFADENSLGEFVDLLDNNPDADFAFSSSYVWRKDSTSIHQATKKQLEILSKNCETLIFGNIIGAPSATIYRRKINQLFDVRLKWVVDVDFYIHTLKQNTRFAYFPKPLIYTLNAGDHQITKSCANNKEVELFEYPYLFNKIYHRKLKKGQYLTFFAQLFNKYNIISFTDLKHSYINQPRLEKFFKIAIIYSRILVYTKNIKNLIKHLQSIVTLPEEKTLPSKKTNQAEKVLRYHLGCGEVYLPGYINVDFPSSNHTVISPKTDLSVDITKIEYKNGSVDEIRLHHVFEHFSYVRSLDLLRQWNLALKPGGILTIETPDFKACAQKILSPHYSFDVKMKVLRNIFGSHEAFWANHMDGWYEEKYRVIFETMGFAIKKIKKTKYKDLHNIIVTAIKVKEYTGDEFFHRIKQILQSYLVDQSSSEQKLLEVWMNEITKK